MDRLLFGNGVDSGAEGPGDFPRNRRQQLEGRLLRLAGLAYQPMVKLIRQRGVKSLFPHLDDRAALL